MKHYISRPVKWLFFIFTPVKPTSIKDVWIGLFVLLILILLAFRRVNRAQHDFEWTYELTSTDMRYSSITFTRPAAVIKRSSMLSGQDTKSILYAYLCRQHVQRERDKYVNKIIEK